MSDTQNVVPLFSEYDPTIGEAIEAFDRAALVYQDVVVIDRDTMDWFIDAVKAQLIATQIMPCQHCGQPWTEVKI